MERLGAGEPVQGKVESNRKVVQGKYRDREAVQGKVES
jgi:hypothetical protein